MILPRDPATPVREIGRLGFPLLIGAFAGAMSGVVDVAMMGRYGTADLAAVSGASAVFDVFSNVVLASVIGHQILGPRFAGREDPAGIRRSLRSSMWFSGGISVVLTLLCLLAGGWLTGLVSDDSAALRQLGGRYLVARGPTLLLLVPFALLAATFNAYKRPRIAMVAGIVVNVVNLGLDSVLIYGPGPAPRLGAVGNGLATTTSWVVGVCSLLVAARRFGLAGLLSRPPGPDSQVTFTTSIPKLAWPAIVSTGLDYVSVAIFFAIVGAIGESALGGSRIAYQMMLLAFSAGNAFAAAGRILTGRSIGSGDIARARGFWRASQYLLLAPGVVLALILVAVPRTVAGLFTSFPPVVDSAAAALVVVGFCLPLMACALGNVSVLRAFGHTRWDMYGNLAAAICVQLPLGWLLAQRAGLGVRGAFVGVVGYWSTRTVLTEVLARRAFADEAHTITLAAAPVAQTIGSRP